MSFAPLKIAGAWLHTPTIFPDDRGSFHEVFKASEIDAVLGREFSVLQVNQSVSKKGVVRGIHWTDSDLGQAKYVSCPKGAIWDFVVDVRPQSPTFGQWDGVVLSQDNALAVLVSEGIGHGFLSLEDKSVTRYLCTSEFDPTNEKTINPFDPEIALAFGKIGKEFGITEFTASSRDSSAGYLGLK
jgi:dTDP-4-dehydrorhamnose 3,5-epimerase